jgi:hypothetical protein
MNEEKTVNGDRVAALEKKDAIRDEQQLASQASSIVASKLAVCSVPERLHGKVTAGLSSKSFIAEGVLDVAAYSAHIDQEVKDWEESIGDSSAVLGIGANSRGEEEEGATEDDSIVTRLLAK